MNVIAGLLIGWFNDSWSARILIPFAWGIAWCVYKYIKGDDRNIEAGMVMACTEPPPGSTHRMAFYNLTATSTSLIFSALAGVIKDTL